MRRPTIADIARQAGVSKGAVSYALNGQPGVSEATRARILAIANEIGWRPNIAARALNGARAHAVGLALCRPARFLGVEPFFMELISGIEAELSARSYALLLQVVGDHEAEMGVYRRWWGEGRVDGAILVDLHLDDPRVPQVEEMGMPVVVLGHPSAAGSLVPVWADDSAAVRETVEYLVALGHRRIARVAGLRPTASPTSANVSPNTSCSTNAVRSAGLSDSSTTSMAMLSDSSRVTRSAGSGAAPVRTGPVRTGPERTGPVRTGPVRTGPERTGPERTGSGSHCPTYSSLRCRAERSTSRASRETVTTSQPVTSLISSPPSSAVADRSRSQASCTTSSASSRLPSRPYATPSSRGRIAWNSVSRTAVPSSWSFTH